ncbi:MAG: YHS domain-containing protein [Alphaproteobacteria bacterium]|nr:MAG: YHS domain-containing protein [Alphaproteobacteria bacterium]
MTPLRFLSAFVILLGLVATPALAAKPEIYTGTFSNIAVTGYDTVAYFTDGEATKGSKEFQTTYKGADWRFSSQEHLDMFLANPEAYAPQYGGYCAWAMANGDLAKGDGRYWTIHEGKLYLNYNQKIQDQWLEDIEGFIVKADANWPAVLG